MQHILTINKSPERKQSAENLLLALENVKLIEGNHDPEWWITQGHYDEWKSRVSQASESLTQFAINDMMALE